MSTAEKICFLLVERFQAATDPGEIKLLGDGLGHMVFGHRPLSPDSAAESTISSRHIGPD